jgi:hypothetical protein
VELEPFELVAGQAVVVDQQDGEHSQHQQRGEDNKQDDRQPDWPAAFRPSR